MTTTRLPNRKTLLMLFTLLALAASTVVGISGSSGAQSGATSGGNDESMMVVPPVERPRDTVVELWSITLTYEEEGPLTYRERNAYNVIVALGDGTTLGYTSRTSPTDASGVFTRNATEPLSVTFTVPRTDAFRYLYYRVGPYLEADGIELWNDDLEPVLHNVTLNEPGKPNVTFDLSYNLIPAGPTPGPHVERCNYFDGRDWRSPRRQTPSISWDDAPEGAVLEIWYDGQPLATDGIDAAAGRFPLPFPKYSRKLTVTSGFDLVTVVPTDSGVRRVAVSCGGWWADSSADGNCTLDFTRRVLWAHTADGKPVELYPNSVATDPVLTGFTRWRRASPRNIVRTDGAEFGFLHRRNLDDALLDQLGAIDAGYGGIGMRVDGNHIACQIDLGDAADGARYAVTRAMDPDVPTRVAARRLEERATSIHLLELLRRELRHPYYSHDPRLERINGSDGFQYALGYHREPKSLTGVERNGRWVVSTESLCDSVADLLDDRQFRRSEPCGASGVDPSSDLCLAYGLTRGMCRTATAPEAKPLLRATVGLLDAPRIHVDGLTPETNNLLWQLPNSLDAKVVGWTRPADDEGTIVLRTLRGGDYELRVVRIDGVWKFPLASLCESGLIVMGDDGIVD